MGADPWEVGGGGGPDHLSISPPATAFHFDILRLKPEPETVAFTTSCEQQINNLLLVCSVVLVCLICTV